MKNTLKIFVAAALCLAATSCADKSPQDREMDRFISSLMKRMTFEEKVGQLNMPDHGTMTTGTGASFNIEERIIKGEAGAILNARGYKKIYELQHLAVDSSRLGIPLLFGMDVIHGYQTVFPIPLGLSCTWDMEAVEESAHIAAVEASADGTNWTFSPMVDLGRDPRWGRVAEGNGEDPYLNARIAEAMVWGYQGRPGHRFEKEDQIMACVKHFALYGAAEAGRDYNTVDMSRQKMFNEYMVGYKAAADAGAGSFMSSFNVVDDVPASVNRWLMTDVLRKQWGWNGFVVTDYISINECVDHGVGNYHEVAVKALKAGVDMDMVGETFFTQAKSAVEAGELKMEDVDRACRRVLEAKYRLGLFRDPYKFCRPDDVESKMYCEEHKAAARRISAESYVLLKNEDNLLPLERKGTIALIGPLADAARNMPGTWCGAAKLDKYSSLLEGMKDVAGDNVRILYAKGSNLTRDERLERNSTLFGKTLVRDSRSEREMIAEAVATARRADVVVAALGESAEMSGECSCRSDITIPDVQKDLLKALIATGKPVVLVLFDGRALAIDWESRNVPAILNVWFGGSEAAYSIADVLFGDVNPSGKLTMTFPQSVGQIPLYYAQKNTGRPAYKPKNPEDWFWKYRSNYLDISNDPVYPFGYGLSYTKFEYGPVELSSSQIASDGKVVASVVVTNTGKKAGKEVVQMYIRDVVASSSRPMRELKGFEKIRLEPGESRTVSFEIERDALSFWNMDMEYVCEPGEFEVFIGPDSTTENKASFVLM
ncbi:MAG: beta-glucosidase BglX [Candidatus Cryptobacteroides sp.]|nr:beta-glucosidase BglX [Candidatus Cryptobacteroides sp.]